MRVVCLYFQHPQNLSALAEVFYRASPQILLRQDRALFLEISKAHRLYSEESFRRRALVTLKRFGLSAKIAIAEDVPTALAFAHYGIFDKAKLPIEALRFYADPLGINPEYEKLLPKTITTLQGLGIQTLGQFQQRAAREIASRFGTLVLRAYLRILGENDIPWTTFQPLEVVSEKHEFELESPVENLEPILFRLRPLLERAFLRLRGKGKRARQFKILFFQEAALKNGSKEYKVDILLQLPYVSPKAIFQIVKEKIEAQVRVQPLEHRTCAVAVTITEEAPYFQHQKDIFDPQREEKAESFFGVVSRMATKLGKRSVFFAKTKESYLPEKNWLRTPDFAESDVLALHVPERPLRLLPHPQPIRFIGSRILLPHTSDEVVAKENQEIIFSDWWENPAERIYFKLSTKGGKQYWVFKTKQGHFLHGEFD